MCVFVYLQICVYIDICICVYIYTYPSSVGVIGVCTYIYIYIYRYSRCVFTIYVYISFSFPQAKAQRTGWFSEALSGRHDPHCHPGLGCNGEEVSQANHVMHSLVIIPETGNDGITLQYDAAIQAKKDQQPGPYN